MAELFHTLKLAIGLAPLYLFWCWAVGDNALYIVDAKLTFTKGMDSIVFPLSQPIGAETTNWIKLFKTPVRHCHLSLWIKCLGGYFLFISENGLRFIYI